jgi:hypothetical protein
MALLSSRIAKPREASIAGIISVRLLTGDFAAITVTGNDV